MDGSNLPWGKRRSAASPEQGVHGGAIDAPCQSSRFGRSRAPFFERKAPEDREAHRGLVWDRFSGRGAREMARGMRGLLSISARSSSRCAGHLGFGLAA